jgi:hypothetical protein
MLTIIVSLFLLRDQSETWICMLIALLVSALGVAALVNERRSVAA